MADLTQEQREQEEFEFRARAEEEDKARKAAESSSNKNGPVAPEGQGQGPINPSFSENPGAWAKENIVTPAVGAVGTAIDLGLEHPAVPAAAAAGYKAWQGINAYQQAANSKLYGDLLNNYSKLNHDIRQYEKAKTLVPQELLDSRARLGQQIEVAQQKIPGYSKTVPTPQAAAPTQGPINPAQAAPVQQAPAPTQAAPTQTAAAQAAPRGPVPPTAAPVAQAAGAAAPAEQSMMARAGQLASRYAPAMRAGLGMAGRLAGPAGLAYSAYEAAPELAAAGQQLNLGQAQQRMRQAQQAPMNMPTPAPLTAKEAKNLLDSGDERTINIYGGRNKLMSIIQPNAINSGYTQELARLSRG